MILRRSSQIVLLVLLLFPVRFSGAQVLPQVITLRRITLRSGIDEEAFRSYYISTFAKIEALHAGVHGWVMKGDRGRRMGKYTMALAFDSMALRDYYFPAADARVYPRFDSLLKKAGVTDPPTPFTEDDSTYTDFEVLGYANMDHPLMGEVMALRFPKIKEGMERDFESFAGELNAGFRKNVEGLSIYVLKGDRGHLKGRYALVWVFDTLARRNLYFPNGQASPEFDRQFAGVSDLMKKLGDFLIMNPDDPTPDYTDYVIAH